MEFRADAAPPELRGIATELWIMRDDGRASSGLPKPFVELVLSLEGTHWWKASEGSAEHRYAIGWVTPVQEAARHARCDGPRALIGARLFPDVGRTLFPGLPGGDGDPPAPLEELIGSAATRLRDALVACDGDDARLALLANWIAQRVECGALEPRAPPLLATDVAQLAERLGMSERRVRRTFARDVGTSPKRWLRLQRLERILRDPEFASGEASLADLSAKHGLPIRRTSPESWAS
ncbi:helix-turn-helix transcriptional regulator [Alteriqipengyuania lutimaris]|uniref:Helix-turn-helix domain-containing protein n=1 Tax=Alteriqipengyuania lutimaris TaxID=1538146 RepID=A0A395LM08_9SPHN|nr:helix-turn-helix domain-containing protein [Alteriqipengyuania lutimaris]MBB3032924.1 AraC-like DNA-binding protein [Alteriqipengyuania lutimaris]RDS77992.1 helix-turn-helix domain-containing protein [Alteriqipengyuania lutimaris]